MQNIYIILVYSRLHILVSKGDLRVGNKLVALSKTGQKYTEEGIIKKGIFCFLSFS